MKISKKWRYALGVLGVGVATAIPLSISLVSCSSDDESPNISKILISFMKISLIVKLYMMDLH